MLTPYKCYIYVCVIWLYSGQNTSASSFLSTVLHNACVFLGCLLSATLKQRETQSFKACDYTYIDVEMWTIEKTEDKSQAVHLRDVYSHTQNLPFISGLLLVLLVFALKFSLLS